MAEAIICRAVKDIRARRLLEVLYRAALSGADPEAAVARSLASSTVRRALASARRIGVFAAGKAAAGMTRAALAELGSRPALVVLPRGHSARGLPRRAVVRASHPEPDAASVRAARRAVRFFCHFGREDAILCLVSGGASSLLAAPRPGLTLAQKRRAVGELARSGASIAAINRLRTKLSSIKGGGLGRATPARLVTLVLSDVPGDRAALVGSGPTIRGRRGDLVEIVGSNRSGLASAAREARRRGLSIVLDERRLSGEAAAAGRRLARRASKLRPGAALLAGGETTVTLGGTHGRGGRSLELALSAARLLEGDPSIVLLAAGSDGLDGTSGAAGAFADGTTIQRAQARGQDPGRSLAAHDTRRLFGALGDLYATGPTGTNVGDWVFLLRPRRPGKHP
jgi:glycerate-2-kinase